MIKYKYTVPIGMFIKKQYCPEWSHRLTTQKIVKTVNSESDEVKNFDFTTNDGGRLFGDVKFTWYVYHCVNCGIHITNKDMRKYEREKKRERGKR
jgi:hypothetical protein